VWAYLDAISIYFHTIADNISHIRAIFQCLQEHKIIASPKKENFFTKRLNLLAHYIDENGLHKDLEKISGIHDWPTLKSRKELKHLKRVIIYYAQYLPYLATLIAPLADLITENRFQWHPVHKETLAQIMWLASKRPVLRPIADTSGKRIFLFTDAFKVGAGA
jgi:hypothetical protein